ncbi:putative Outer membrane porin protein 32 precursor; 3-hydroxyphenylpropionic acid porine [Burkholderia cepacia]|nr:putative Outer membrane porin protein 32 precursor; 3-hydroxyphenylpropionic acid porine [Burkholderia cepacia]
MHLDSRASKAMLGWSVFASSLTATTGSVQAQGSVTLYGIVDTGISYYNHAAKGGSAVGMPHLTGELPSRWGVKGTEDLGGGNRAFFVLESGFQPGTGRLNYGGRLFGRQANVGLSSAYGTLTLGRQMNMTAHALANADVIGPSIHSPSNFDAYLPNARSDNAIGYLGKFRGLTIGGTYSFGRDAAGPAGPSATGCAGQVPGNPLACRQYTALVAYDAARFGVAVSYDVKRGRAGASAPLDSSAHTSTHGVVGGYAVMGRAKLGAGWIRNNVAAAGHLQTDIVFAGVAYALTPTVTFDAQGTRYLQRGPASNANATLLAGRANHQLSRRTRVYTSVGYMLNGATAGKAVAAGGTVETGRSQLGIMAGLQQRF